MKFLYVTHTFAIRLSNVNLIHMANIQLSGIGITAIENSVGQTTFSRNSYGSYAKQRIGEPATTSWLIIWQTQVSVLRNRWQAVLSESDRKTWYDHKRPVSDNIGRKKVITGYDLYMSVNLNLFLISYPPVNIYPSSEALDQIDQPILTASAGSVFFNVPLKVGVMGAMYVSKQYSVGRMSLNQIFGFLGFFFADGITYNFTTQYSTRQATLISGKKIFCKWIPINPLSGRRGVAQYASVYGF